CLQGKNRIAQELHDTVLQMLFGVGLRLQWSLEQLPAGSALRAPLEEARHLSARAGGELRGAIFTLCSDIAEIGLVPAVERLVREQAARAGWAANVVVRGAVPELPVLVQNAAHRVVREALMNAYKHARATEVVVSLRFTPAALTVVVQDNGVGIPAEALAGFRQTPDHFGLRLVDRRHPDVVLLDLRMPGTPGIDVCRAMTERHPQTAVIILTAFLDSDMIYRCIQAGAKGYVVKDVERADLKRKIRAAARGEGVLDVKAASPVLERLRRGARAPVHLTEREITILKLTAEGMTNKEIGQQLYLSEATVKDQLRKIMDKLGVDHRISAVIVASKEGLI